MQSSPGADLAVLEPSEPREPFLRQGAKNGTFGDDDFRHILIYFGF